VSSTKPGDLALDFIAPGLGQLRGSRRKKKQKKRKREGEEAFAAGQNLRQRQAGLAERTLLQSTPSAAQQRTLLGG
jgi:hypothetical protein